MIPAEPAPTMFKLTEKVSYGWCLQNEMRPFRTKTNDSPVSYAPHFLQPKEEPAWPDLDLQVTSYAQRPNPFYFGANKNGHKEKQALRKLEDHASRLTSHNRVHGRKLVSVEGGIAQSAVLFSARCNLFRWACPHWWPFVSDRREFRSNKSNTHQNMGLCHMRNWNPQNRLWVPSGLHRVAHKKVPKTLNSSRVVLLPLGPMTAQQALHSDLENSNSGSFNKAKPLPKRNPTGN